MTRALMAIHGRTLTRSIHQWGFLSNFWILIVQPTEYGPGALVYPTMGLASAPPPFSPASLLRAISGTASPSLGFLPNGNGNHYTVPPTLDFIDGMASQEQQPTKQHLTPNGTALAAKSNQQSPSTTLNATPLTQSRRAKSPLVGHFVWQLQFIVIEGDRSWNNWKTPKCA